MDGRTYKRLAMRTLSPNFYAEKVSANALHAAMGLCTEAGEIQDNLKRALFYGKDVDKVNLVEELGDVLWYCALLAHELKVELGDVMEINIEKLRARFPNKFTDDLAIDRHVEKEREIIENFNTTDNTQRE